MGIKRARSDPNGGSEFEVTATAAMMIFSERENEG